MVGVKRTTSVLPHPPPPSRSVAHSTSSSMSTNPRFRNLMHGDGNSSNYASSSHNVEDDDDMDEEMNDGGPEIEDLVLSYKAHVGYAVWNGLERGILTGHHQINSLRS